MVEVHRLEDTRALVAPPVVGHDVEVTEAAHGTRERRAPVE